MAACDSLPDIPPGIPSASGSSRIRPFGQPWSTCPDNTLTFELRGGSVTPGIYPRYLPQAGGSTAAAGGPCKAGGHWTRSGHRIGPCLQTWDRTARHAVERGRLPTPGGVIRHCGKKGALDRAMATTGGRTGAVFRIAARGAASPGMEGCSVIESGCPFTAPETRSAQSRRLATQQPGTCRQKIARLHVTVHHRAIFASLPASWPSPASCL